LGRSAVSAILRNPTYWWHRGTGVRSASGRPGRLFENAPPTGHDASAVAYPRAAVRAMNCRPISGFRLRFPRWLIQISTIRFDRDPPPSCCACSAHPKKARQGGPKLIVPPGGTIKTRVVLNSMERDFRFVRLGKHRLRALVWTHASRFPPAYYPNTENICQHLALFSRVHSLFTPAAYSATHATQIPAARNRQRR
jgi:hypothetical protein